MAEILFKNVNGKRIQMGEQEAADFEASRERSRLKRAEKDKVILERQQVFNDMCARLSLSDTEKDILLKGIGQ